MPFSHFDFDSQVQGEEVYTGTTLDLLCPECGTDHGSLSEELSCPGFDSLSLMGDDDEQFAATPLGGYTPDYDEVF